MGAALGVGGAWATYEAFGDIVDAGGSLSERADVGMWASVTRFVIADGAGPVLAQRPRQAPR